MAMTDTATRILITPPDPFGAGCPAPVDALGTLQWEACRLQNAASSGQIIAFVQEPIDAIFQAIGQVLVAINQGAASIFPDWVSQAIDNIASWIASTWAQLRALLGETLYTLALIGLGILLAPIAIHKIDKALS